MKKDTTSYIPMPTIKDAEGTPVQASLRIRLTEVQATQHRPEVYLNDKQKTLWALDWQREALANSGKKLRDSRGIIWLVSQMNRHGYYMAYDEVKLMLEEIAHIFERSERAKS